MPASEVDPEAMILGGFMDPPRRSDRPGPPPTALLLMRRDSWRVLVGCRSRQHRHRDRGVAVDREGSRRCAPTWFVVTPEENHRATFRLTVVVPAYIEEGASARPCSDCGASSTPSAATAGSRSSSSTTVRPTAPRREARAAGAGRRPPRENRGKGAAVRAGVLAARGRTIAFTDADLAYAPRADARPARAGRGRAGTSWSAAGATTDTTTLVRARRAPRDRRRAINLLTQAVLLGQYRDTQCGLKAFRSDVARLIFAHSRVDGFAFDVEVFHLVERYQLSLTEVPVGVENSGRSTVHVVRDALRLVRDLFRVRQWSVRGPLRPHRRRPPRRRARGDLRTASIGGPGARR